MPPLALPPGGDNSPPPPPRRRLADLDWRSLSVREWCTLIGALALTVGGFACFALAAGWHLAAWGSERAWVTSEAAQQAEQVVDAAPPIWLPPATPQPGAVNGMQAAISRPVTVAPTAAPVVMRGGTAIGVQLLDAGFTFLDPPQPGAHARFVLKLQIANAVSSTALVLVIPGSWLDEFRVSGTTPTSSTDADGQLRFVSLPTGVVTLNVDVVARGDRVDPPVVHVQVADTGQSIGDAHPQTVAPRPAPGPVSALRIPRLGLNVAVVPTSWEPPAFIVGQLRDSANVTQGNTVLVGHLGGAAGEVFKNLDQLQAGDSVVAVSRGVEYPFIISRKEIRPSDDSQLAGSLSSPRLTLMTCDGTWDPLAHNYSDRVWVIAEPPDRAWATIAYNVLHPATPTPVMTAADGDGPQTTPVPAEVALASGLGAPRASLDASLGPPLGETPGKLVVYRQGSAEYHVAFTDDPPRARLVTILPIARGEGGLSVPTAVLRARAEFPTDATPRTQAPDAAANMVVERWASPALARAIESSAWGGDPGDFLAAYARDTSGAITRVVIGVGDDPDALLRDAVH